MTGETGEVAIAIEGFATRVFKAVQPANSELLLYQPYWLAEEKVERVAKQDQPTIIFAQQNISQLAWQPLGKHFIWVSPAKKYKKSSNSEYQIRPDHLEDYEQLVTDLKEQGIVIKNLLHLWNLQGDGLWVEKDKWLDESLKTGIYSLVYLLQAINKVQPDHELRCLFSFASASADSQPQQESIAGLFHSLKVIQPLWRVGTLQLDAATLNLGSWQKDLLDELSILKIGSEIRYQAGKRLVRQLKVIEKSVYENISVPSTLLKPQGIYLITGGLGGIGFIFAEYLAKHYQARLVLMGRRALTVEQEAKLKQLEEQGAEVLYVRGDVSSFDDVTNMLKVITEHFGHLDGVFHAAGLSKQN